MASVRYIAKQAGVSIATVSRALNNDPSISDRTRELVKSIAHREGYTASRGRRVVTHIGVMHAGSRSRVYDSAFLEGVYDSALLAGMVRGLDECRLNLVILNSQRDKRADETYTQYFRRKGLRGVILRTTTESRPVCQAIADEGFPAVVISERFDTPNVNYIDCDSRSDSARAVEYLISLGHRRIAFAMHNVLDCDHLDRFEGYKEALAEHGLPLDERLVFQNPGSLAGGATVMERLSCMPDRPTAIYFADQVLAVGGVNKAHALGLRIPQDLSVVGFDDAEVRYSVYPQLTAVCQDASRMGFEAALQLGRLLAGQSKGNFQITIPSFFEVNESTAPPPDDVVRFAGTGQLARDTQPVRTSGRADLTAPASKTT